MLGPGPFPACGRAKGGSARFRRCFPFSCCRPAVVRAVVRFGRAARHQRRGLFFGEAKWVAERPGCGETGNALCTPALSPPAVSCVFSTFRRREVPLDAGGVGEVQDRLRRLRLPLFVQDAGVVVEGTHFEVSFARGSCGSRLEWSGIAPGVWKPLEAWFEAVVLELTGWRGE